MADLKKITPMGLVTSIMTLAAFGGLLFSVDARYITKAEAADKTAGVIQQQQLDRVETDLALIELEIQFLEEIIKDAGEEDVRDEEKRLAYLEQRRMILERYQLELQSK